VLAHREVVGGVLLATMLFFSALAFTVPGISAELAPLGNR
jgi:hypothetical protein